MKRNLTKRFVRLIAFVIVMAIAIGMIPAVALAESGGTEGGSTNYRLWYTSPATENYSGWQSQSLPIGNGKMGASIFGAIKQERLQLNEETFWSGGPDRVDEATGKAMRGSAEYLGGNIPANGQNGAVLRQVQQHYLNGNNSAAASLAGSKLIGVSDDGGTQGYGYMLSFGSLFFDYQSPAPQSTTGVSNYVRDLDIGTAVASVSYEHDGTKYTREYFVSHEDDVLVTRLTAEGKNKLNVNVKFDTNNVKNSGGEPNNNNGWQRTANKNVTVAEDQKTGSIVMTGKVNDNNLQYDSQANVVLNGEGTLEADSANGIIKVKDATSVVTMTAIKTDYKQVYPGYRTGESAEELRTKVQKILSDAQGRADAANLYQTLKQRHTGDYKDLFDRLNLDLGQQAGSMSTDAMLNGYKNGSLNAAQKRYMEVLLYQYGRYLTIAGSREDSQLPTNLQGIWTFGNSSPWHSDFHANVNLQMNYWPTYASNLPELARPIVGYVDALQEPGQVTSQIYAGIEDGMMFHTQINPYGWTCPGWSFSWGWSTAAMPWIIQNCWEYYEYTQDEDYLRTVIYPLMQKACTFYEQYLVDDGTGKLVSTPAYSPEHGPITNGNIYEQSLIWQLFDDTVTAGKVLGEDEGMIIKLESIRDRLKGPVEIGESGQIKEWFEETTIDSNGYAISATGSRMGEGGGHRHISHMLAAFPGDYISEDNPELLEAAKVSMKMRTTTQTTGWAMAQRVNTWARLGDAQQAYTWIQRILQGSGQGGTFQNMWGYHGGPYFQIDGNFGYTAGVNEMLMQSNLGYIHLLPALPAEWGTGSISGMLARGNFELDMQWANQHPTRVEVTSNAGGDAVLNYKNIAFAAVTDSNGNPVKYTTEGMDKIRIQTQQGQTYVVTNIPEGDVSVAPETPEGLKAERVSDEAIMVTWNPVRTVANEERDMVVAMAEGEESTISYNLYRQFEGGSNVLVAAGLKADALIANEDGTLSYQDAGEVAPYMGAVSYQVAAVRDGVESRRSAAAKVAENAGSSAVESVSVTTASGVTTVGKQDSQLQMVAKVAPDSVTNTDVTWTIVNNGTNASISAAGVLNAGTKNGTIDVKATSRADGKTQGQTTITVSFPMKYIETYVDDGTTNGSSDFGVINPIFTFDPPTSTWGVWAGEREKHYGGTKAESSDVNAKLSYAFEGVGIAIYGQKHNNFGAMKVVIDGEEKGTFSMNDGNTNGTPQQLIAKFEDLEPGTHTITISPALLEGTTKKQANLDFFVIYQPNPDVVADKSALQAVIEAQQDNWLKTEDVFEAESWTAFATAWNAAVEMMNNADATEEGLADAAQALSEAGDALVGKDPAPLDMSGANLMAQGVETQSLVLKWDKIEKAQEYNIYRGENKIGSTKNNYIRVINLQPGTDYAFRLEAVAKSGATGSAEVNVKTLSGEDVRPQSAEIVKIQRVDSGYAVTWKGDGSENQLFNVRVNGTLVTEKPTADTGYLLTGMPEDSLYTIAITAISNGNSAAPTAVTLRYGPVEVTQAPESSTLTVKRGTSFDALKAQLPQKAVVGLSDGSTAELAIEWQQGSYNGMVANTYTIDGTLVMGQLMTNPTEFKAQVEVTVPGGAIADMSALEKLVADIEALKSSDFRSSAWKVMMEQKLPAAQAVLINMDATQDMVDNAWTQLFVAKNALMKERINKQGLETYIRMAEERIIMTSDFTASSINATKQVLERAKAVYADGDTTQSAIDKVGGDLFAAVMNMLWQADKGSLGLLVEAARELSENLYTPDKWAPFAQALQEAEDILKDTDIAEADQAKVETARKKLFDAMQALVDRADTAALKQAVDMATDILNNADKYAPASLQGLQDELNKAKEVLNNANATQKAVDDATKALNDLLVKVYPKSNKVMLNNSIKAARGMNLSLYTAQSAQTVTEALANAEKQAADENVRQDVVDQAQRALDNAVKSLVPDPSKPQQPETTPPVDTTNPTPPANPGTPGTTTPADPGAGTTGTTFQPDPEPTTTTDVADAGDANAPAGDVASGETFADGGLTPDQEGAVGGAYYDPETETGAAGGQTVMIGDTPVPLVGGGAMQTWSLINMILMIWTAAFGGLAVAGLLRKKKASAFRLAWIIMGVGAIAVFFFTQTLSGKMAIVDQWTVLMGVIAAAQLIVAFVETKFHNMLKRTKA